MSLTFDEGPHEYHWSGARVPSVTQLLDPMAGWGMVDPEILAHAQARGTAVHRLCHYFDEDDLDPRSVGSYGGYLAAWVNWRKDYQPDFVAIERPSYSQVYRFAGTPDREAVLHHRVYNGKWIVDIKTGGQPHRIWGMQTAAYRHLVSLRDTSWLFARRATVQLFDEGEYKFLPWDDPDDWPAFQALLFLTNWSKK
jgi:hypothetical protein